MVSSELTEVLGISDRVLVIGEGRLRGDFVNDNLTQEHVLAAALASPRRWPEFAVTAVEGALNMANVNLRKFLSENKIVALLIVVGLIWALFGYLTYNADTGVSGFLTARTSPTCCARWRSPGYWRPRWSSSSWRAKSIYP